MSYQKNDDFFTSSERRSKKPLALAKTPASITAQIEKLRQRGCIIDDEEYARFTLQNVNYYRLAFYFSIFLVDKNHYREGTNFRQVLRVYDFDRHLRNLILEVLEEIEIAMRAHVSNYHAVKYGATGYLNADTFDRHHRHENFLSKLDHIVESNSDSNIVKHHVQKYDGFFPLWVLTEMFSFGMLNVFYSDMKPADKDEIAKTNYGVSSGTLESWLKCMSDLRNHCAHYNRLYGSSFENIPKQPATLDYPLKADLFSHLVIIRQLYFRKGHWFESFMKQLGALIYEHITDIDLALLGFPSNWAEILAIPNPTAVGNHKSTD